ncbi:hypothetical protein PHSY_006464 [Pseudozyma hubeiensis SY62]|uniref:F-box domain-containing protein n=1 Tax=Pseudozyma hubeiensis (strain SY62) TaxID=1305764 RepID=R9PC10_PSEHS|nr:hypothetical protein PHSY_006464 [Pseudozyma hubeiensis SY62]GAC98869.1 hypothetical protein PHSY_006464 [Pseudozyma hubeiensis SY62]
MQESEPDKPSTRHEDKPPTDNILVDVGKESIHASLDWLRLPTEIWEHIISYLRPSVLPQARESPLHEYSLPDVTTHNSDILALGLTCKRLKLSALPALNRWLFLQGEFDDDYPYGAFLPAFFFSRDESSQLRQRELAGWIRALHIDETFRHYFDDPKVECRCDVHNLASLAHRVRYLSIVATDAEEEFGYGYGDSYGRTWISPTNHPFVHFLSRTTRCRPLGLKWAYRGNLAPGPLSLREVTSYAPLSRLTHLELDNVPMPLEFYGFLTGDLKATRRDRTMQDAIKAGRSPCSTLEHLEFSDSSTSVLARLKDYLTDRKAYWTRKSNKSDGDPWQVIQDIFLAAIGLLAANSCSLPKLKLLVFGVQQYEMHQPYDLIQELIRRNVLAPHSRKETSVATEALSTLFRTASGNDDPNKLLWADSMDMGLQEAGDEYDGWRSYLEEHDYFWRGLQAGKQKLLDVWNASREKNGLEPTEVRIVAKETRDTRSESVYEDFIRHAERHDVQHTGFTKGPTSTGDEGKKAMYRHDPWDEQDVFSLVETMPWLGYYRFDEYGCCSWSGRLPRDNNPNSFPSSSGVKTSRIILPPIIKLDTGKSKDTEIQESQAESSRRARDSQETGERDVKRHRANSSSTQQAGPSHN